MLMVDPAYQCKGVGRSLVQWGLNHAKELGVEVYLRSYQETEDEADMTRPLSKRRSVDVGCMHLKVSTALTMSYPYRSSLLGDANKLTTS